MRNSMQLVGTLQYFMGMDRPTNVSFDGILEKDGQRSKIVSSHVEDLLNAHVCTNKVGSTSERTKVKITVEWE